MNNAGPVVTTLGGFATFFVAYRIYEDMTGAFFRHAYGTTGHPEQMTGHEIGNLIFLTIGIVVTIVGVAIWRRPSMDKE